MAGKSARVSFLVDLMLQSVSMRGKEDLKYHLFETIYSVVREGSWPWNFKWSRYVTSAPIEESDVSFSWVAGGKTVTSTGVFPLTVDHTGRHIVIDNRPYRVVKILVASSSFEVDAPLHTTGTDESLVFLRTEKIVHGSSVYEVQVDGCKISSSRRDWWRRLGGSRGSQMNPGKPLYYEVVEDDPILPPRWAPVVDGTAASGLVDAGTYKYFFTFYDVESGDESAPGPELTYESSISYTQDFKYGSTTVTSSRFSYQLRLYRSRKDPVGDRYAAFLIGTLDSQDSSATHTDNASDASLQVNERIYSGPSFLIRFWQAPDAIYSLDIRHINGWHGRPDPDDVVNLGRNNVVTDLLPLGASIFQSGADRSVGDIRGAIISFRGQMNYLITNTEDGNHADPGLGEMGRVDGKVSSPGSYDPTSSYTYSGS